MTDKTYTAADFAKAEFARHPDGGVAARVITSPRGIPWSRSPGPGISAVVARTVSDADMAHDGWYPVWECQDRDVHRRHTGPHVAATCDVQNSICEAWPAIDFQTSFPSPAKAMRYQRERDEARAELAKADAQIEELNTEAQTYSDALSKEIARAEKAEQERDEAKRSECPDKDVHWRYVDLLDELREARRERDEADKRVARVVKERDQAIADQHMTADQHLAAAVLPIVEAAVKRGQAEAWERGVDDGITEWENDGIAGPNPYEEAPDEQ